jgi:hypothetical protein
MTVSVHHVLIAILSWILLFWAAPVTAGTVAIVQPNHVTLDLTESVSRIHGELLSVGLEVKLVQPSPIRGASLTESRAWIERIAVEGQIDAVIEIIGESTPSAVDVWVLEREPRRLEVSRIVLEPSTRNAAETLAIRAVEVLRSTFLENDMEANERRLSPKLETLMPRSTNVILTQRMWQIKPSGPVDRFGVAAGVTAFSGLDGVGFAIMPTFGVAWKPRSWFELQMTLTGLGTRPTASNSNGRARIGQEYATLGGCFGLNVSSFLWPFLSLAAGVMHTTVEGHAELPRQEHQVERWSLLIDGSLGAKLPVNDRYYFTLAAHVQLAEPYVVVHVVDSVVATTGRPNLVLTLTVGTWL